jgi:hypothetical protein
VPRLCCRARHMTPCARKLATAKSIAKTVVEEGGRRDRFAEFGFFSVLHTCLSRAYGPRNLMKIVFS